MSKRNLFCYKAVLGDFPFSFSSFHRGPACNKNLLAATAIDHFSSVGGKKQEEMEEEEEAVLKPQGQYLYYSQEEGGKKGLNLQSGEYHNKTSPTVCLFPTRSLSPRNPGYGSSSLQLHGKKRRGAVVFRSQEHKSFTVRV